MPLDSSPLLHEDSGYAEFAAGLDNVEENASSVDYEPTRYCFYRDFSPPQSPVHQNAPHMQLPSTPPAFCDKKVFQPLDAVNMPTYIGILTTPHSPALSSARWLLSSSPSPSQGSLLFSQEYPPDRYITQVNNTRLQDVAQMPDSDLTLDSGSASSPTPASTASYGFPSSADDSSLASLYARSVPPGDPEEPPLVRQTLIDALQGELFEGADPWRALDRILGLQPSSDFASEQTRFSVDQLRLSDARGLHAAHDRSGVGYHAPRASSAVSPRNAEIRPVEALPDTSEDADADADLLGTAGVDTNVCDSDSGDLMNVVSLAASDLALEPPVKSWHTSPIEGEDEVRLKEVLTPWSTSPVQEAVLDHEVLRCDELAKDRFTDARDHVASTQLDTAANKDDARRLIISYADPLDGPDVLSAGGDENLDGPSLFSDVDIEDD
ncbi:hypothetical protein BKA93DRAFT_37073 [Sparassis latifolia]